MGGANAVWLLGCRVGADLLNFALFLVVSRRFGPPGLGVYAYGFALAGVVYAITASGIEEYGIREYARRVHERTEAAARERSELVSDLVGAQLCIAATALMLLAIYLWLTDASAATLAIVTALSAYQVGCAFAGTLFIPAMAAQRMIEPAVVEFMCRAAAFIGAGVLILALDAELRFALLVFAAAGLAMSALAARSARRRGVRLRPRISSSVLREGFVRLWSFALVNVFSQLLTRIGVIALSLHASAAAAGVYATGLKLVETLCLPIAFMGVALYPKLSQAYVRVRDFSLASRAILLWGAGLTAIAALLLWLAVPPILTPLLGPRFAGAEPVVAAMAALLVVQGAEIVLGRVLLAGNRHVARAAYLCGGAILCIATTLAVTPHYGVFGALFVAVGAYAFVALLYAVNLRDLLRRTAFAPAEGRLT